MSRFDLLTARRCDGHTLHHRHSRTQRGREVNVCEAGLGLAIVINGELQTVHPDSPLLPDLSSLILLVKELFPLPPDKEPPGFE
jgi:hypothetical protein